ncbi:hypothetical protein JRO89_XS02G0161900 [Xanthoceras sorbifolium]|uniref:Retroviral polymerase SH3-like domain-containing protein n=1 Tax=Xanthoceras sorbifolium TaxID=99658 RepID=A0ABQ8IHF4_9ROSI|nr:hypothetical protein JRO89_XS02G0161900 [Xanthoceras sorbifolium]
MSVAQLIRKGYSISFKDGGYNIVDENGNEVVVGIFLGKFENSKGFRIYNVHSKKLKISRDMDVDENAYWNWENGQVSRIAEAEDIGSSSASNEIQSEVEMEADLNGDQIVAESNSPILKIRSLADVYERFKMEDCKAVSTPSIVNEKLSRSDGDNAADTDADYVKCETGKLLWLKCRISEKAGQNTLSSDQCLSRVQCCCLVQLEEAVATDDPDTIGLVDDGDYLIPCSSRDMDVDENAYWNWENGQVSRIAEAKDIGSSGASNKIQSDVEIEADLNGDQVVAESDSPILKIRSLDDVYESGKFAAERLQQDQAMEFLQGLHD